jgi:hypothetical protein
MSNSVDARTDEIADEIRANFQSEDDSSIRHEQEFHAACFRCAVIEQKLKHEQEFNKHSDVRWKE